MESLSLLGLFRFPFQTRRAGKIRWNHCDELSRHRWNNTRPRHFHGPSTLVDGADTSPELGRMLIFWQSRCDISGPAMSFQCGVCQGDLDTLSQSVFFNAFLLGEDLGHPVPDENRFQILQFPGRKTSIRISSY